MFKSILRKLKADKRTTIINIAGFALSMAVAIVLLAFVISENSYNKSYTYYKDIYRVVKPYFTKSTVEEALNENLSEQFSQIEASCRFDITNAYAYLHDTKFRANIADIDQGFFKVFDIPIVAGYLANPLEIKNGLILTRSFAETIFGNENPIGEIINLDNYQDFKIVAICEDLPQKSSLQANCFISYKDKWRGGGATVNGVHSYYNYMFIRFKENTDHQNIVKSLSQYLFQRKIIDKELEAGQTTEEYFKLQAFSDLYFDTTYQDWGLKHANNKLIQVMLLVAIIIFSLAIFNYINLSTAAGIDRIKDIGIRKTIGASNLYIFKLIMTESVIICTTGALLAFSLALLINPVFENIIGKEISILSLFSTPTNIVVTIALIVMLSLISGIYPALTSILLTSKAAINKKVMGLKDAFFRQSLNVLQLIVSVGIIVSLAIIIKQTNYVKHKNPGFNTEHLLRINFDGMHNKEDVLKDQLNQNPSILNYTITRSCPGMMGCIWGDQNLGPIKVIETDHQFLPTHEMQILEGRNISKSPFAKEALINETLYKHSGWTSFEDKTIYRRKVVGIVKDFHFENMFHSIDKLMITHNAKSAFFLTLRIDGSNTHETLEHVRNIWKKLAPRYDFNFTFIDDSYASMYQQEENYAKSLKVFAVIAILISCMGIFGLAEYTTKKRIKEIGVRKVNGAKIREVLFLINKEFIVWIIIASIIAIPITYYIMLSWIQTFAYRTIMSWWIFLLGGLSMLIISLLSISTQTWQAARRNPIEALRYE